MLWYATLLFFLATNVLAYDGQKSVIILIPDGFGPQQATLAREVSRVRANSTELHYKLAFDEHIIGTLQTKSASSLVTDSAAGGTAYSCGINTNNGHIGTTPNKTACGTILEGARALGYNTGLVSTTRITHATPASFAAHTLDRDNEQLIARQLLGEYELGRTVDLLWGGGRGMFLPQSDPASSREDDRDLIQEAKDAGYYYISNAGEFKQYRSSAVSHLARRTGAHLPSLGLFTRSHMSYEIDRDPSLEPSLAELAHGALDALNDKPFFLMVEGGRIDHAAHANDPAATYHDIMAYEEMYAQVISWVDAQEHPDKYVVFAMADHDTGGVVLPSNWSPESLLNATNSVEWLDTWTTAQVANLTDEAAVKLIDEQVLVNRLGVDANVTVAEALLAEIRDEEGIAGHLAALKNEQAGLPWGTGGHSQVDVNVGVYPWADKYDELKGNNKNTKIAQFIAEWWGMDLDVIAAQLADTDLGPAVAAADE